VLPSSRRVGHIVRVTLPSTLLSGPIK
jgi:hypothetical protein